MKYLSQMVMKSVLFVSLLEIGLIVYLRLT